MMLMHYVDDRDAAVGVSHSVAVSMCGLRFVEEAHYQITLMAGGSFDGRLTVWSATGSGNYIKRPFVLVSEFEDGDDPADCLKCLRALTRAYEVEDGRR